MGKVYRIRVRGKQRKHPDAALVAQAIIQLGRELWEREQQRQQEEKTAASSEQDTAFTDNEEARA
jgi:hypothetical protein